MNEPRRIRVGFAVLATLVAAAGACGDDPVQVELQVIEEVEFDPGLGIDLAMMTQTVSGVYIQDNVVGDGDPIDYGADIGVTYVGWLVDGTLFDAGELAFVVGELGVILGFHEGVLGMRPGGERRIIIPPDLAYGRNANGPIPAGSILIFDITLDQVN